MFNHSDFNLTVTKIISANRTVSAPVSVTTVRHNRERWALSLKANGKTIYNIDGKEIMSDSTHPILLPKSSNYAWKCIEPGECLIIEFEAIGNGIGITSFEIKDNSILIRNFAKIKKCLTQKKSYYELECCACLYEILLYLAKSREREYVHPQKYILLQPALKYIHENYFDSNITNDILADYCGMSTVYFRKTFYAMHGISPIKYLHNFRIEKAQEILLSDYESIEQVALSVGYNSIYHFSKMFKTYMGISPSEYAKSTQH